MVCNSAASYTDTCTTNRQVEATSLQVYQAQPWIRVLACFIAKANALL